MLEALENLKNSHQQVLFVGVGNVLRQDDGVGVYIGQRIVKKKNVDALVVEVSIENYIGKINALKPDQLIIVDCVDLQEKPGSYRLIDLEDIQDMTTNTHNISLGKMKALFDADHIKILGVQPGNIDFGEGLTEPVEVAATHIVKQINNTAEK